jgi:hypothetical protein
MTGMTLRLSKIALFDRIGFEPHQGQIDVHKSDAKVRVLACGARWGKSTCASMEAVAALLNPCESSIGWIVAPTYDLSLRVFLKIELVVREKLAHRLVEFNGREHRIVIRNLGGGLSTVVGKSADKPTGLLGEGLDWVIVDEAARLKREVWENFLSQRLIDKDGWALLLSTPLGLDWFYKLYRRGKRKELGYASWSSPSWTNPLLNREVIEVERARLLDEAFRQEYGAEFVGEQEEPCDICGGPDPDVTGSAVIEGEYEFAKCVECGKEVDEDGHTLWVRFPNGTPSFSVIQLIRRAPIFVNMPFEDPSDPAPLEYDEGPDTPRLFKHDEFFRDMSC